MRSSCDGSGYGQCSTRPAFGGIGHDSYSPHTVTTTSNVSLMNRSTLSAVRPAIATPPAAGMVMSHAVTMLPATFQRTDEAPREVPTPMIAEAMTCVVDSG